MAATLTIREDGSLQYVDSDSLNFNDIGKIKKERASHVEPNPEDNSLWDVDLSPVNGPLVKNFTKRKDALEFEHKWIEENVL